MSYTVLIVDDEENARQNIGEFLNDKGYDVVGVANLAEARDSLRKGNADIILLDVQLPDGYGPSLIYETEQLPVRPPVIIITAFGDIEMAVEAMKNGAHDFLSKPIEFTRLEKTLDRACEAVSMRRELVLLRQSQQSDLHFIVGKSDGMKVIVNQARRAAEASVSVLVTGETGTGKEVLAKFIHNAGPRADKPFVPINCAAIQPTVLESELFGYEAGAFTGADKRKLGLMEVADGGILFLDEISSMPLDIQAKLLRAIEDRSLRRVGGTKMIQVDVQILAASNRDLPNMIKENQFREDLYYRLKVVDLHLPPLRERREDIPELAGFFVRRINMRLGMNVTDISQRALEALVRYQWPGNIRELSNAIERALLFCDDAVIDLAHLPADILRGG
ncbi:MAG: sigma-54 dependent transcriptional regulator [Anaerolineaceae bacterium]|jgi:DNA-binding NtrC family response regulator|nr:sigma-54 dependent transcriptional regulator [Anaerolineaceae bacterium]